MYKSCSNKFLRFVASIFLITSALFVIWKYNALECHFNGHLHSFEQSKLSSQTILFSVKDTNLSKQQAQNDDTERVNQPIHIFNGTGENVKADCVPLHHREFKYQTRICIYNTSDDIYVSGSLKKFGAWEEHMLRGFGTQFQAHPDALFIDVGSQIGTYTMYATAFGYKAITIDPLKSNLQLLSKSLRLAHQEGNVTLLWNAVSNVYEDVWLRYERKNIGSTHIVKKGGQGLMNSISAAEYSVQTILLDDLVDNFQVKGKKIIMKMDIEGSEFLALLGASKLFRENTICYVSMELTFARKRGTLRPIVEYMKNFGFELFDDPLMQRKITLNPDRLSGADGFFSKECI